MKNAARLIDGQGQHPILIYHIIAVFIKDFLTYENLFICDKFDPCLLIQFQTDFLRSWNVREICRFGFERHNNSGKYSLCITDIFRQLAVQKYNDPKNI